MPSIVIRAEGRPEEKISLESSVITLGRAIDSDIRLNDVRSSRKHCQIISMPEGYSVVDLGSGNGTKVNGIKIKEHKLVSGDLIQIGSTLILFSTDGAGAKPPPRPTPQVDSGEDFIQAQMVTQVLPRVTESTLQPFATAADQPVEPVRATTRVGGRTTANIPAVGRGVAITSRRMGAAGRKTGTTSRTSGRVGAAKTGASSRFAAVAQKKSPMKFIVIGGLVLGIAAIFFFMSSGKQSPTQIKNEAEDLKSDIAKLEIAGKFKEAIALCDEATEKLKDYVEDKEIKKARDAFKSTKTRLEQQIRKESGAMAKCKEIKDKVEKTTWDKDHAEELRRLWEEAKEMKTKEDFQGVTAKTGKEIDKVIDRSREAYLQSSGNQIGEEFATLENTVSPLVTAQKYGEAIRLWNDFVTKYEGKVEANKAKSKVEELNRFSKSLLDEIRQKAEDKAKDNKDAALQYLNECREKLKGTASEADLDKLVTQISGK